MKASEALAKIPVVSVAKDKHDPRGLRRARYLVQFATLVALILIPASGLFRIDMSSGFIVLDRQIWFSDFLIVFGLWLAIACTLILVYSTLGTVFCGWVCPQNTFSSLANHFTFKHLGKRAVIDWHNKDKAKLAARKNHLGNWVLLGLKLLAMAMLVALIPLFYFYPPEAVWAFMTFSEDARLAGSLHWIYTVFVFILFVNFAVIRHFTCRYMCIYRMWQFLFKTKDTLHIEYDASRSADCEKCQYCLTACMVEIDPRKTSTYDSCTNCGACITACDTMHAKKGEKGLLRFKFGPRSDKDADPARSIATVKERLAWVMPVWLLGMGLFAWGLYSYQPYHLTAYKASKAHGQQINEYRINLASKVLHPATLQISVEGLDPAQYQLSKQRVHFDTAGREDVFVRLEPMPAGLHTFLVRARADDGWEASYRLQHYVAEGRKDE